MRDLATGENLIGVAVVQAGTGLGTATNTYGFYSLTVPTVGLDSVRLPAASIELAGAQVVGDREAADDHGPRSTRTGTINVPIA